MSTQPTPEALRLADELERDKWHVPAVVMQAAADELRRLHSLTQGTQPTDDELQTLWAATDHPLPQNFARAVLELWGTPATGGEPVAQWQKMHLLRTSGKWENTGEHDAKWWRDNSPGWEIRGLYTSPPVREPMPRRTLLDMTQCYSDRETFGRAVEAWHGITGGQHG